MRVGVLGLGNVLRRDDALGPTVVRLLESRYEVPEEVVVLDLGTPGLDLASHLIRLDAAVIVDAIESAGDAGALRRFTKAELMRPRPGGPRVTQHEADLREALATADLEGSGPKDVVLVGVVAKDLRSGMGFSREVAFAQERALGAVLDELAARGVRLLPRETLLPTGSWWA